MRRYTSAKFEISGLDHRKSYIVVSLGNIVFKEETPLISIILYELKNSFSLENTLVEFSDITGTNISKFIEVDFLTILSVGCCLHDKAIFVPDPTDTLFVNGLGIENSAMYKSERKMKVKDFKDFRLYEKPYMNKLTPAYGIPFAKHHEQKCLSLKDEGTKTITVIPCIEVIRFYYCTSSSLSENLFNGGLKNNKIAKYGTTNFVDSKLDGSDLLILSKQMLDCDARYIARIFFYKEAYRSADAIYRSIVKDKVSKRDENYHLKGFLDGFFPFNDTTTLGVTIKQAGIVTLESDLKGYTVRYVLRIHYCAKPFLPLGFQFTRENDSRQVADSNPDLQDSSRKMDQELIDNEESIKSESPFCPTLREKKHIVDIKRFINEPKDQHIRKLPKEEQKTTSIGQFHKIESGISGSFSNETDAETQVAHMSLNINPEEKGESTQTSNIEYFAYLDDLFKDLNTENEFSTTCLPYFFKFKELKESISSKSLKKGKTNLDVYKFASGVKILNKNKYYGHRQMLRYHLTTNKDMHNFYLIDLLPRTTSGDNFTNMYLLYLDDFRPMHENDFKQIALAFSHQLDAKFDPGVLKTINRKSFKHDIKYGAEHTVLKIKSFILSLYEA